MNSNSPVNPTKSYSNKILSLRSHYSTSQSNSKMIPLEPDYESSTNLRKDTVKSLSFNKEMSDDFDHNLLLDEESDILSPFKLDEITRTPTVQPSRSNFDAEIFPDERAPLLPRMESFNLLQNNKPKSLIEHCTQGLVDSFLSLPAVFLGLMLTILDAMSYGIIIFPASDKVVPETAARAGISMFLASSVIAQTLYTFGSGFKGVNGSMMIEVMPFLHLICKKVEDNMYDQSDSAKMATIMVAYAVGTLLTGTVFLLLGVFKLGNVVQFFPRLKLWLSSLTLAVFLKLLQRKITHALFVPLFYALVPVVFYVVVNVIFKFSLEELRELGWLFDLPGGDTAFYEFYTYYDFYQVDVKTVFACFPIMMALTFFGVLHVPINVPALSVSTKQDVYINREIVLHGVSNLIAGLFGTCQNYLVYTNSVLIYRSGGKTRITGFLLSLAILCAFLFGGSAIGLIPVIVVGSLIFHLAIDLVKESVYDTYRNTSSVEYATILGIIIIMTVVGFTEGIIAGIVFASVFFVYMYSQKSIIRSSSDGTENRSTIHRPYRQQKFLDAIGKQIVVVKLSGFLFF
ncbi:hypothetical protein HK099_001084, partial [Clydaea vesicula]